MTRVLVATNNAGKLAEIEQILAGEGLSLLSPQDIAEERPWAPYPDVIEDGGTFEKNAVIKATTVAAHFGLLALADDSGIVIDALGGEPGVRSARYAGPDATDAENNSKMLSELKARPGAPRSARYRAVVALASPNGELITAAGDCEGAIVDDPRGTRGFGYDPYFVPEGYSESMAQLAPEVKNSISHRGAALRGLRPQIDGFLQGMNLQK